MVPMDANSKIISKIQKLMALSESPNEAEATAAAEKAQKLMLENGLAAADIADNDVSKVDVSKADTLIKSGNWRLWLAAAIAETSGGKSIMMPHKGTHNKTVFFYGPGDTAKDMIETFRIMERALETMARVQCLLHKPEGEHGRTWMVSFLNAATSRICARLRERHAQIKQETNNPQALVLASTAVERKFSEDYPKTSKVTSKSSLGSADGAARGRKAGNEFSLGEKQVARGRGQLTA